MNFVRVRLGAASARLPALADFYGRRLALPSEDPTSIVVGQTVLELAAAGDEPFYHFALLVPGDRFEAAFAWVRARTELLPDAASGELVFRFEAWDAEACYFHDPAGNIVELIAHRGVAENGRHGGFDGRELAGMSELGLVGDQHATADALSETLGLEVWDGALDVPGSLAFVGERARTLILAPEGRGWLPTARPARRHSLDVTLSGAIEGELTLEDARYRIRVVAA